MDMKKWVFITSYTRRILSTGVSYTRLTQSLPLYDLCRPAPTNPPKKDPNALSKLLQSTSILSLISKVRFNFSLMIAVNLLGRQNGHLNTCRYSTILILPNIRSPVTTFLSDGHQGEGRVWGAMERGEGEIETTPSAWLICQLWPVVEFHWQILIFPCSRADLCILWPFKQRCQIWAKHWSKWPQIG